MRLNKITFVEVPAGNGMRQTRGTITTINLINWLLFVHFSSSALSWTFYWRFHVSAYLVGRGEMLNSCGFVKVEMIWWACFVARYIPWSHFFPPPFSPWKFSLILQREKCQISTQLYLDSRKWNNCHVIDNLKSREMILLIKSWNIRQAIKHRYI